MTSLSCSNFEALSSALRRQPHSIYPDIRLTFWILMARTSDKKHSQTVEPS